MGNSLAENNQPTETVRATVCPLDCADTCSLDVTVQDNRVIGVRGSDRNPFTRGKLCAKVVKSFPSQVHGKQRILEPLLRQASLAGANYKPVSWDYALDLIHERFQDVIARWGSEAIAPLSYGGPMGVLAGNCMDARFFNRLGASQVDSTPLCAGTSSAAWDAVFGDAGGIDFEELAESKLILVWGNNVTTCNLHLTKIIREARKNGSVLVVVDPKRTRIARDADLHIPLLPGTDVVLAYAVAALLNERGAIDSKFVAEHTHGAEQFLEEATRFDTASAAASCGIDPQSIEQLAEYFQTLRPAGMSIGVGPERNRNGSAGLRAAFSLMALTGNVGPRGAGVCDTSRFFPLNQEQLSGGGLPAASARKLNVLDIPRYVLNPGAEDPLRALFIYNHNPVAVHPQQQRMREALLSDDVFVVGSDVSMTDSMLCADLVLPAQTHFEYGDIYKAYGHRYLQQSKPVVNPQGEALSNMELFRRLALRFGFDEPCFGDSDEALTRQALGGNSDELLEKLAEGPVDMDLRAEPSMLRGGEFTTPSGRIELYSEDMAKHCDQGLPRFYELTNRREFILVTPASEQRINSTFGSLSSQQSDLKCEIHPDDAAKHQIDEGMPVLLSNDAGEVELPARLTSDVPRGTLFVPKGAWIADSGSQATANTLIPGHQEPAIGGACYYDCTVDIRPVV